MRNRFRQVSVGASAAVLLGVLSTGCSDRARVAQANAESPPAAVHGQAHAELATAVQSQPDNDSLRLLRARADSFQAVLQQHTRDSIAAVKQREDSLRVAKQRLEDSLIAERKRPRDLLVFQTTGTNVDAAKFSDFGFVIDSIGDCALRGRVEALTGGNKDVQVLLMTDDEFVNWQNSPQGPGAALFSSPYQTVTTLDVPIIKAGRFHLVISNRISTFTQKSVKGSATVTCVGGVQPRELSDLMVDPRRRRQVYPESAEQRCWNYKLWTAFAEVA